MGQWIIFARVGVAASLSLFVQSCVPSSATPKLPAERGRVSVAQDIPAEATIADAAPLLQRLDLQVGPAELPPLRSDYAAGPPATSFLAAARSADDATRAIECMTAAIYYEARSEPVDGQRAVAQVVMNRVRDRAFPNSVCGVVYQGSNRTTGCQFSFTCDGSLDRPRDGLAWERSRAVALNALNGDVDFAVGAATHYHATSIFPWWAPSLRRIGVIGHHAFYRWAAPLERALSFRQRYAGTEPGAAGETASVFGGATEDIMGVTVHRSDGEQQQTGGAELRYGVSVHRGSDSGGDTVATSGAEAAAPTRSTDAGETYGVRVHRSTPVSAPAAPSPTTATAPANG